MDAIQTIKRYGSAILNDAYGSGNGCCIDKNDIKVLTRKELLYSYATWTLQVTPSAALLSMLSPRITYLVAFSESIASFTVWPKANSEKAVLSDHRRAHCIRDALSIGFLVAAYKHSCNLQFKSLPMVPMDLFCFTLSKYYSYKLNEIYPVTT
jgi:hypothetical protein